MAAIGAAALGMVAAACSSGGGNATAPTTTAAPTTSATVTTTTVPAATTTTIAAVTGTTPPASGAGPCGSSRTAPARYDHVVWIWMENHTAAAVLHSDQAPFERDLAATCGSADHYRSVGSPSLPNYLGATSGSTHGVHDDGAPASHPIGGDNLFRQVDVSGGTARSFEEGMPMPCALASSGRYAPKHNPQAYFSDGGDRAACLRDDVPLGTASGGAFVDALAGGTLPTFSFVTPDLCDDTHDCPVATGDAWLRQWVGAILASPTYAAGRTAVFVVWDEPTPMPLLVVAPSVPTGTASTAPFDHYSLLRTTEELLGLAPLLGQAATAADMRPAFGL